MISCNEWNISIFLPFINISNVLICLQRKFWITKIRHACHISTSRLGSKGILDNISSKLYKNMLNRRYYWHLLSCETFCKTGITKYSLKNFFPSLTDLTNLPTCTNPGASSNGWFHWSAKTFAFRGQQVRCRIFKKWNRNCANNSNQQNNFCQQKWPISYDCISNFNMAGLSWPFLDLITFFSSSD